MLEIRLNENGFQTNQNINLRLFEQVGNSVVRIICERPYYFDVATLENSVCEYMSQFMPEGFEVKTSHCTYNSSTGTDKNGKYIKELVFQVYI